VPSRTRAPFVVLVVPFFCLPTLAFADHAGNANAAYQQLRNLLPAGQAVEVKNLEIKRDAATITFRAGSIAFYGQVNGKITGAVFIGDGHFHLTPPNAQERHYVSILTHSEEFDEDFDRVVLRFTDATAGELQKAATGTGKSNPEFAHAAQDLNDLTRKKLLNNIDLRILEDVMSPAAGGYFLAAMHGKRNPHLVFTWDPCGDGALAPEEVSLLIYNDWGPSWPAAFHQAADAAHGGGNNHERNAAVRVDNEDLDVTIEKNGFLTSLATVHVVAIQDGVAVVPLALHPTLRVSNVETDKGVALDYVQEKKEEDADFGVILAQPLKKGEATSIRIAYGGKDAVKAEGGQNYYPIAREDWYPNASQSLGDYATYHMLFHVPKGLQIIATGTKVSDRTDGKITITEWKTDVPLPVVGFNLGDFTMKEATIPGKLGDDLTIDAYANKNTPDSLNAISQDKELTNTSRGPTDGMPMGKINTAGMLPVQLSQGEVAARLYSTFFGSLPFAKVALTQQYACNYGQSWPMLVYLPICGFLDSTQQFALGVRPSDMYWKVVTPHEVAHQWWGQTVGFGSYRDQWMSEGFSDTSASIFLQATEQSGRNYREFWKEQQKLITEKNQMGFRPIDVGPVTMGFRLSSDKTGWNIYQNLVYPKGAFILQMIRSMMWTNQYGDARFINTMHDFIDTYRMKAATTEDFKAIVEKHMSPQMDIMKNHTMDWFFNEYVYGTELPNYHLEQQINASGDTPTLHFRLTQSGVSPTFKMIVPFYLEFVDGRIFHWASAVITGDSAIDQTVPLPKTPSPLKRILINYNYDVLCTEN
jgi:hypothetical protein